MSYADKLDYVSSLFGKSAFANMYPTMARDRTPSGSQINPLPLETPVDGLDDWGIEMTPPPPLPVTGGDIRGGLQRLVLTASSGTTHITTNLHKIYEESEYDQSDTLDFRGLNVDTQMVLKFVLKYFTLNKLVDHFWDKLKYNIVLSNLLDDTMIASKNEQAMKDLASRETSMGKGTVSEGLNYIKYDGSILHVFRKYRLQLPSNSSTSIFSLIYSIILMLKQLVLQGRQNSTQPNLTLFKIILLYASRFFHYSKIRVVLATSRITNLLNDFFMWNYKINKKLISHLLALKELTLFSFLNPGPAPTSSHQSPTSQRDPKSMQLYHLLNSALSILIINIKGSILNLLPLMNGDVFEKYCNINTINFQAIMIKEEPDEADFEGISINKYLSMLTSKLSQFNQLRKLLLCQFLSLNETPKTNFFASRIHDEFTNGAGEMNTYLFCASGTKFYTLQTSLLRLSSVVESLVTTFDEYEANFPQTSKSLQDEDILSSKLDLASHNSINNNATSDLMHLDNLIDKIANLAANLKYFKKYHTSTAGNCEEMNEKLNIFNQFSHDIQQIKELHHLNLSDLSFANDRTNLELMNSPSVSSSTSKGGSNRNSSDNIPLKSFQNSSLKKRFSLPSTTTNNRHYSIIGGVGGSSSLPILSPVIPSTSTTSTDNHENSEKKYKKLSTGLQLGLLTVVEETKNGVAFDDNYLNLAPTPFETYNKATLDQLNSQRNRNSGNSNNGTNAVHSNGFGLGIENNSTSRFSLYSVASNMSSAVSDLVSTTQITDYETAVRANGGGSGDSMTKEQLRMKLEESFNRIYNLEQENSTLRLHKPESDGADNETTNTVIRTGDGSVSDDSGSQHTVKKENINGGFISELEKTFENVAV